MVVVVIIPQTSLHLRSQLFSGHKSVNMSVTTVTLVLVSCVLGLVQSAAWNIDLCKNRESHWVSWLKMRCLCLIHDV